MIGKKNVVFGFLFLVLTAALGPLMVLKYEDWGAANGQRGQVVGYLQELKAGDYLENPETLEDLSTKQLSIANTESILAMNKLAAMEQQIDSIKGGPHAHGNLEALLNIVVGIALCFIVAPVRLKQLASWLFILGSITHAGLLYLERVFMLPWANVLVSTGIGPVMILLGLLLMAVLAIKGFQGEPVKDYP